MYGGRELKGRDSSFSLRMSSLPQQGGSQPGFNGDILFTNKRLSHWKALPFLVSLVILSSVNGVQDRTFC